MRGTREIERKAVVSQKEGARLLGVTRHRFDGLEKAGYFRRLNDPNGGTCYLASDLRRFAAGEVNPVRDDWKAPEPEDERKWARDEPG